MKIKRTKANSKSKYPRAAQKEATVRFDDPEVMLVLFGEADCNLHLIERYLEVATGRDNAALIIRGQDAAVDLAVDVLEQLHGIVSAGEHVYPGDIERAIKMLSSNRRARLADLYHDQIRIAGRTHTIIPKTFKQKEYLEAIRDNGLIFGIGPAGTGKTYLAMAMAVAALLRKEVKRVVLCRPAVEAGEKLGFLPGDMAEKVNPYLRPLYDALHDMVEYERARELVEKGNIEVAPLAFMRGRTLSNAFVILDEAQNTTPVQMKMLLTRLGLRSKCIVTGDITQIDLPPGTRSGLRDAMDILTDLNGIAFVYFSEQDVIRHPIVADIVAAYQRKSESE
jgi:phosphate starvation-inducible PhoH-like protein